MRVLKINEPTPIRKDNGWWLSCTFQVGHSKVYGYVICNTSEEACSIKENQLIDVEKTTVKRTSIETAYKI